MDHHVKTAEYVTYNEDGQPCVGTVESGLALLSVVVRIETGDVDSEPIGIVETSTLICDGESIDLSSVSALSTADGSGEAFDVGFEVAEDVDASACELELRWQGDSSSAESFRFGLGPSRNPDIPEDVPRCDAGALRESFAVVVARGEQEQQLFGAEEVSMVGQVEEADGRYRLPVTLSDDGIDRAVAGLREAGALDNPSDARILVELDGEVVMDLGLSAELAEQMDSGGWDGRFLFVFDDRETVEKVREVLAG